MNPHRVFVILLAAGAVWTALWGFVMLRAKRALPAEETLHREHVLRRFVFALFAVTFAVLLAVTLPRFPYYPVRVATLGAPADTVGVTALQWAWSLSRDTVRAQVPVEFDVTAMDVNHDFAIYDSTSRLVAQVQAMPGYTNRLVHEFARPGTYTVRCLEYCGVGHHVMLTTFTVVPR